MEKMKFKDYFKERCSHKFFMAVIAAYVLFCIFSAIYFGVNGVTRDMIISTVYIAFAVAIFVAEYIFGFRCGELLVVAVIVLAAGGLAGTCWNVYTLIPSFDTFLHGLSGVLFACFGFTFADKFFPDQTGKQAFFGKVMFAVCFSLAIAVVWEIFEYTMTAFAGFDMMEDSFVDKINSYLLAGSHSTTVSLENIIQTVIYYGDGQQYTIDGYLDLGLIDTLNDMIVCTLGAVAFTVVTSVSFFKLPKINEILIPQNVKKKKESA